MFGLIEESSSFIKLNLVKSIVGISDIALPSLEKFGLVRCSYCHLNRASSKCQEAKGTLVFASSMRGCSAECKLWSGSSCFLTCRAIKFAWNNLKIVNIIRLIPELSSDIAFNNYLSRSWDEILCWREQVCCQFSNKASTSSHGQVFVKPSLIDWAEFPLSPDIAFDWLP